MLKFQMFFLKIISFYYVYYFLTKFFFKTKEDSNGDLILEKGNIFYSFLPGLPKYVKRNLKISKNYESLIGSPIEVGNNADFSYNLLRNLDGIPQLIGSNINCSHNLLISLKGVQEMVYGHFDCSDNLLTSLKYSPIIVNGNFNCSNNNLTYLEGSPTKVNGDYDCSNNKITTLYNSPKEIGGSFNCSYTKIFSLENCPKLIKETLNCKGNQYLKDVKEQIIKYGIKAKKYETDEGDFTYEDIFEKKEEELKTNKIISGKLNKTKSKLNDKDFGLGI